MMGNANLRIVLLIKVFVTHELCFRTKTSSFAAPTFAAFLSSSSVTAPRKLSQNLLDRLGEIAAQNDGKIPLHGRLFAQWMHHAFPRECPFPHLSGTTNPQSPDEWLESTGEETTATDEEMQVHIDMSASNTTDITEQEQVMYETLPWSPEEELLVLRNPEVKVATQQTLGYIGNIVLFMALISVGYALQSNLLGSPKTGLCSVEKYLV